MHRLDRLTAILLQLQTRRVVRAQELADRYAVNVRTIYRDLRTLEEAGVPLLGEAGVGFSLAEGYRLPPVMFSRGEVTALLTAEKLAEQFTDPATARLAREAMDKVRAVLRRPERDYAEDLHPRIVVRQLLQPPGPPAPGPDTRQQLMSSLAQRRVVRLQYRPGPQQPVSSREVEPIGLYFQLHWHLLAYCRLRQDLRNFRLDRIEALQVLDETFAARPETLHSYWEQQRQPGQPVLLRFTARGYALVRDDKYLFGWEQERTLADGAVEMTLRVHSLPTVAHWLLYFGVQVSIEGPAALREALREMLTQAARHHFPPGLTAPTDTP